MIQLRPYQSQAVDKLLWSRKLEGADICVLPTGAGKSIVIAELTHRIGQPMLILQPTREILEQNLGKLKQYVPESEIGVYSASLNKKIIKTFTFATIGSIYQKADSFTRFGQVIVDECHLVNPLKLESMYASFFNQIGDPKVFGFTATPYRQAQMYERLPNGGILTHTTTKLINRMKERFWHRIMFNIDIADLISQNYLLPLKYIDRSIVDHATLPTNKSKSDFDLDKVSEVMDRQQDKMVEAICFAEELADHVLVFCSSVAQATTLAGIIPGSAAVTAKTKKKDRVRIVDDFRSGRIKTVFNVGVFTTGFDFPELDAIVLLRPTQSIGLYNQMLGRGVRRAEGKESCKVIDMTGTVKRLGRIETMRLVKRDLWELESEMGSWHNRRLYSFEISH